MTLTYSSGPAVCTVGRIAAGTVVTNGTFIYNYLLDGWIYNPGSFNQSVPIEAIVDSCNRVGANLWFCWGITRGSYVTAFTNYVATNLNTGLKFGTEVGNELWNFQASPCTLYVTFGACLNFQQSGLDTLNSYGGLRTVQFAALSRAAWASAGRVASDHYILQMGQSGDLRIGGNFDIYQLKGTSLTTSNTVYATYGGLNGGSAPSYTAVGSRPVDVTNAVGFAPYWGNNWLGNGGSYTFADTIIGSVAENAPWLQASKDYANGLNAAAFTAMVHMFDGTTARSGTSSGGVNFPDEAATMFAANDAMCAQYDAQRATLPPLAILDYEGGPSWAIGENGNNGVNGVYPNDVAALANQMTALGWNVSGYTLSGTDNKTEMATMYFTMSQAFKYDPSYKSYDHRRVLYCAEE